MTETRTTYFELPAYSSDSDETLTRGDWNEASTNIEARAAYDDGAESSSLPTTLLKPGRYVKRTYADGYVINRRSAGGAWDWVGGTIAPIRQRLRASGGADVMLSVDQGSDASTKFTLTGAGDVAASGGYSGAYGMIAADGETNAPATTGRLYVRTKVNGEMGVVLRPHGSGAGAMLAAQDSGGSTVTQIDALGRFQQRSFSSLGGAAMPSTQAAAIAPSSSDDGVHGLLVHGWSDSGTANIANKDILRVRGTATASDLIVANRNAVNLGRAGWTGGAVNLNAPTISMTGSVGLTGSMSVSGALAANGQISAPTIAASGNLLGLGADGGPAIIGVTNLPASGMTGQVVYHLTQRRFYRWDGTAWQRWTASHSFTGSAGGVSSVGTTITNWTQLDDGHYVTVNDGAFHLGIAGVWSFLLSVSSGFAGPGVSVAQLSWAGGPFPTGFLIDQRYRASGFANSGNLAQSLSWTGPVTQDHIDAADFIIGLRSHNVSGSYTAYLRCDLIGLL